MILKKVQAKKTTLTSTQKIKSPFLKANLRYCIIGSSLILTGLLKISRQESHSFTRVYFDNMYLVKLINESQYFLFQLAMLNIQMMRNISFIIPMLCFNKNPKTFVGLAAWLMNLSTLGDMFLQDIFPGELNHRYIINIMDTKSKLNLQLQLFSENKVK